MKPIKEFFKITYEDIEIAEDFFDNEKHFSEWLFAVMNYYRGKEFEIKTKIVQKYFNTYKKTMDFILQSKKYGYKGAVLKAENQTDTKDTLKGVLKGVLKDTLPTNNKEVISNNKTVTIKHKSVIKKDKYDNELEILLSVFNEVLNSNIKDFSSVLKNYEHWRKIYEPSEIQQAIQNIPNHDFWNNKMTFNILFRQKNTAKENVDYISDLLNFKVMSNKKTQEDGLKSAVFGALTKLNGLN